jgi:hypothetical protein
MRLSCPCLVCKKCGEPIPLPSAKRPGTLQNQPSRPMDGLPRNFLCPHCKRVFEYFPQDVHHRLLDSTALGPLQKGYSVVSFEVPCDERNCKALVKMDAVVAYDADLSDEVPKLIRESIEHNLLCPQGHSKFGQGSIDNAHDARFDEDWETDLGSAYSSGTSRSAIHIGRLAIRATDSLGPRSW